MKECPQTLDFEEFEDNKEVIRIRKSKKNRKHNGQEKKYKRTTTIYTKHTHKTKDWVTRTLLKTGGELRCSGRVGSSCSTSGTRRVNQVTNSVISHEWGKDREVFTTNGTYPWPFVTPIFHNGQPFDYDHIYLMKFFPETRRRHKVRYLRFFH